MDIKQIQNLYNGFWWFLNIWIVADLIYKKNYLQYCINIFCGSGSVTLHTLQKQKTVVLHLFFNYFLFGMMFVCKFILCHCMYSCGFYFSLFHWYLIRYVLMSPSNVFSSVWLYACRSSTSNDIWGWFFAKGVIIVELYFHATTSLVGVHSRIILI